MTVRLISSTYEANHDTSIQARLYRRNCWGSCDVYVLNFKNPVRNANGNIESEVELQPKDPKNQEPVQGNKISDEAESRIHIAVVACGERLEETIVMLKSSTLLTKSKLQFHIFAENDLHAPFKKELDAWPDGVKERTAYSIYPITFPDGENAEEWKKLFKPCASQRLFLPNILANVDSILYVDTDILFMRPLDDIWAFFGKFNSSQIAALAPESEDAATGWYNRFARHPFYGKLGVNSGVMLMNLTRMRIVNWQDYILPYYKQYKLKITWGDQDLINIFSIIIQWNYRPDHCMYMSVCKLAEMDGVSVLHGSRGVYHNEKQPAFKAVYTAMKQYTFDGDLKSDLVDKANALLMEPTSRGTNCGKVSQLYFKQFQKHLHDRKAQDNSQKKPPS